MGVAQALNVVNKPLADPAILKGMMNVAMSVWGHPGAKPEAPIVSRLAAEK